MASLTDFGFVERRECDSDTIQILLPLPLAGSPSLPGRLERHERADGTALVSRGVWISDSPLFATYVDSDDSPVENPRPDRFSRLPAETVARVLHFVEQDALALEYARLDKLDVRKTGWIHDPLLFRSMRKKRCAALRPLLTVSHTLYPLAVRALWTHLDLTGSNNAYTTLHQLIQTAPEALALAPDGPSHGSLVRSYSASGDEITTFIASLLPLLPNISSITFSTLGSVKNASLALLAAHAGRHLRSIDRLSFAGHEDESTRAESIIRLHNRAVNLVRWGVKGLVLTDSTAKRLSFVLRLNSSLVHEESGAIGGGLRELHLGGGCHIPVTFLRTLPTSAPRLTKLWIKTGVTLLPDTTPNALAFDLRAFCVQWPSLTALTFISTAAFVTQGTFDDIFFLCPHLEVLHLRSDHITFSFFQSLQARCDDPGQLRLESLAIQYRLPIGDAITVKAPTSSVTLPAAHFAPYSKLVLSIEAQGLTWPTEMAGQRDVLERARWMLEGELSNVKKIKAEDHRDLGVIVLDDDDDDDELED